MNLKLALALICLLGSAAVGPSVVQAQPESHFGNPYEHGLRILLFPATFSAGISQSSLGSALRADLDLGRAATLHAGGGVGWLPVLGEDTVIPFNVRLGASFNFSDRVQVEPLDGTVRPAAPAHVGGGQRRGTDTDLDMPMSQKLGSPPPPMRERDAYEHAKVRVVHALRAGYELQRSVQQQRGVPEVGTDEDVINDLYADQDAVAENLVHALSLGYGWSTHWNLTPAEVGERELGFRRFYVDVLLTLPDLTDVRGVPGSEVPEGSDAPDLPVGLRVGMEGAFAALLRSPEALGFGYLLEVGALPGKSGAEGYLLIGLGVAFEISTLSR